jgi:hypothetical protein
MTGSEELHADPPGLRQLSDRARQSAEALGRTSAQLGDTGFGAGRDYPEQGRAVHDGVARVAAWLRQWSDATAATATALHTAAVTYAATEDSNEQRVAGAGDH